MRFAHHDLIYSRLGLNPKRHIPPDRAIPYELINVSDTGIVCLQVCVRPSLKKRQRVMCICLCKRRVPVGRLFQHVTVCDDLQRACRLADRR